MKQVLNLLFSHWVDTFANLKYLPWKWIGDKLLLGFKLYSINFALLISCMLVAPLLNNDIINSEIELLYRYFIDFYKIHIWFYVICLIFVICEDEGE